MTERWIVETESGTRYLIDMTARTMTRLPATTGGEPVPIEIWPALPTRREDGRLRRDEEPGDLLAEPGPWPPTVGEPLQMDLEIVPGVACPSPR